MVIASTTSRSGSVEDSTGGDFAHEGDDMRIHNPDRLPVRVLSRAAGGESLPMVEAIAPANRATLKDLTVQPPGSPARFSFPPLPPNPPVERRLIPDDDRIAAIVAKALEQMKPAAPAVEAAKLPSFEEFLDNVHLPGVLKKTERDERTLSKRRLLERVGFCSRCRITWRLETTKGDNCPRCSDARTICPGIDQIDSAALNLFAQSLLEDDGNPATAAKRLRYLMAVLNDATDRGLIRKVRKPKIAQAETLIRTLSDGELVALYRAAGAATWPKHDQFSPADFWRAFIVAAITYGFRLGEALSLPWFESLGPKKLARGLHPAAECPRPELRNLGLMSPRGWLVYLPAKQKAAKPCPLVLPVRDVVADHLDTIKGDRRFVFDVYSDLKTRKPGDYRDVKVSFYRQWYAMTEAAGIPSDNKATPHDLRRTQETRYDLQLGKGTGGEINGHASRSVSDTYYSQAVPRIHRAVLSVVLPQFV